MAKAEATLVDEPERLPKPEQQQPQGADNNFYLEIDYNIFHTMKNCIQISVLIMLL